MNDPSSSEEEQDQFSQKSSVKKSNRKPTTMENTEQQQRRPFSATKKGGGGRLASDKRELVVKSALCIIPPQEIWEPIQAIRKEHDKAYPRWMPHINLLYPFYDELHFEEVATELRPALSDFEQFNVTFKSFDFFTHKASSTLWLGPDQDAEQHLEDLYAKLAALYPESAQSSGGGAAAEFSAHLSVGQWGNREINDVKQRYNSSWKPLTFKVGAIYMISRHGFEDPFEIRHEISLKEI